MKMCDFVKENIFEYLYNEIDYDKMKMVKEHLRKCSKCKEEVAKMKNTLSVVGGKEIKSPEKDFWNECWKEIRENISPLYIEEKKKHALLKKLKAVFEIPSGIGFKFTGVAAVLLIGFLIGKSVTLQNKYDKLWNALERLDNPAGIEVMENSNDERLFRLATINFLTKTEIILLEFSDLSFETENIKRGHELSLIKNLSRELINETRVFKKVSERFDNIKLKELLNIMELILIEINNLSENDNIEEIEDIKQSMVDSGLLLEIRNMRNGS